MELRRTNTITSCVDEDDREKVELFLECKNVKISNYTLSISKQIAQNNWYSNAVIFKVGHWRD